MRSSYFYLRNSLSSQVSAVYLFLSLILVDYKSIVSPVIGLISAFLPLTVKAKLAISKKASNRSTSFLESSVAASRNREANSF